MDKRTLKTRTKLTNSYIELKLQDPEGVITVTEVCRHAGINKSTFYRNYLDIDDLYNQFMQEKVNELFNAKLLNTFFLNPEKCFLDIKEKLIATPSDVKRFLRLYTADYCTIAERTIKDALKQCNRDQVNEVMLAFISGGVAHVVMSGFNTMDDVDELSRIVRYLAKMDR